VKAEEAAAKNIGIVGHASLESLDVDDGASQSKEPIVDGDGNVTDRSMARIPLPGELDKPKS
jgi:hypothetical protein